MVPLTRKGVVERDGMCSTIHAGGDGLSAQWWIDRKKAVPVAILPEGAAHITLVGRNSNVMPLERPDAPLERTSAPHRAAAGQRSRQRQQRDRDGDRRDEDRGLDPRHSPHTAHPPLCTDRHKFRTECEIANTFAQSRRAVPAGTHAHQRTPNSRGAGRTSIKERRPAEPGASREGSLPIRYVHAP
jgi:hypothetical protein